ncbi:putative 2OG-Fe(II) oxygenase [Burkholderia phage FLC6]|nr:putative 2OG-Fe(II) oxygenase [Burkholderia phage FLC6]
MTVSRMWETPIGERNLEPKVTFYKLLDEVMNHPAIMQDIKVGSLRISDRKDEFPECTRFIEHHLMDEMKGYVYQEFGARVKDVKWSAWIHTCFGGTGLVPHYHMGPEHFASILYLTDSKASLIIRDPRANMVRNFPQELKHNFADYKVDPRVGDFVIFPTYLDHYVMAAEPDMRVSIAIDWCLDD